MIVELLGTAAGAIGLHAIRARLFFLAAAVDAHFGTGRERARLVRDGARRDSPVPGRGHEGLPRASFTPARAAMTTATGG